MKPFRPTSQLMASQHGCCHHADGLRRILEDREKELLHAKGPCSNASCRLHYAHSGPCEEVTE